MASSYINFGANGVSANANFFMFAAKATPWANESVPDSACNSVQELTYNTFDEMIFAKYIPASNINLMVARHDWVSGNVYAQYDDQDVNLFVKNFFVVTSENGNYNVWKCLNNNGGTPSTAQPLFSQTSESAEYYSTVDGYQWKFLYTISAAYYTTFTTVDYIPLLPNANVAAFASNGGIETILVQSGGNNYNSYASGFFAGLQLGGNSVVYGIQASDSFGITLSATGNAFSIGETILQPSTNATASVIGQANNTLTTYTINGQFAVNAPIVGLTSNVVALPVGFSSFSISANNNFYTGCSLYIQSGTGAGQLKKIANYQVTGTQRILTVDSPFVTSPDFTSNYYISPTININGDGTAAQAIALINPASNTVSSIEIINRGSNYSFANVSIIGNTGFASNSFTSFASTRAIISPIGGHGANLVQELDGNDLGFSTSFLNTENGQIPANTTYRKVGILSNPKSANVSLTITSLSGVFTPGENLTQYAGVNSIDSITRNYTNQFNYVIGNYKNLNVANTSGFAANTVVNQPSTLSSGVVIFAGNNNLVVRSTAGSFSNVYPIYAGNTSTNTAITTIAQGLTNSVFGLDGSNNALVFGANSYAQVLLNNRLLTAGAILPYNTTYPNYTINSSAVAINNYALANTDLVSIKVYTETVILSNTDVVTTGTVLSSNSTTVNLTNVSSYFQAGLNVFGATSNATAIVSQTNQTDILDFRTILNASYSAGSANLVIGDLMYQGNTVFGYVSSVEDGLSSTINVGLTKVKGSFTVSSNSAPQYIKSADTTKNLQVISIKLPKVIKYSGMINYFENQIGVQRSNTQTEVIKVVITS